MLPAAVDQDEVVEQMRKGLTRDRHAQLVGMGEVGLGHVSRLRRLAEDDVALGTLQRPPLPHPPPSVRRMRSSGKASGCLL